jgi:hypothetical protein
MATYALRLGGGRFEPVRFLDPSVGTGSFYSALRQVLPSGAIAEAIGHPPPAKQADFFSG